MKVTVFTPSFNRSHTISRVYSSLLNKHIKISSGLLYMMGPLTIPQNRLIRGYIVIKLIASKHSLSETTACYSLVCKSLVFLTLAFAYLAFIKYPIHNE